MISCTNVKKDTIRFHYDLSTLFYRLFWGTHIHHGLWRGNESNHQAQLQLTQELARLGQIRNGDSILDVGCGMGGSSIHLARNFNCHVTGLTISPVQQKWASTSALLNGVRSKTTFRCIDAELFEASDATFDVVWSIECTEHLFDKGRFFQRAARWLRPGGRIAICAWLAGDTGGDRKLEQQVYDVCEGFFCPSLGTMQDYETWFTAGGLRCMHSIDWTQHVTRTWEICRKRINRSGLKAIVPWIDGNTRMFLDRFDAILEAYQSGAMRYGCLIAEKPAAS